MMVILIQSHHNTPLFLTNMLETSTLHQQRLETILHAILSPLVLLKVVESMRNDAKKVDTEYKQEETLLKTFLVSVHH